MNSTRRLRTVAAVTSLTQRATCNAYEYHYNTRRDMTYIQHPVFINMNSTRRLRTVAAVTLLIQRATCNAYEYQYNTRRDMTYIQHPVLILERTNSKPSIISNNTPHTWTGLSENITPTFSV